MRASLAVVLLLSACGAQPPRAAVAPTPAPAGALAARGARVEVVGFGLSAEFSGAPKLATQTSEKVRTVYLSQRGPQSYQLTAVSTHGRDRPKDEQWFESLRAKMKLQKTRDVRLAGFEGIELSGVSEGHPLVTRLFAVGDTLFVAEAIGSEGPLDKTAAQRFLDSLQLELPWRIYASPTSRFSVMVPTHAIELDKTRPDADGRASSRAFFVGGLEQLTYWTTGEEITERNPDISDDQILDAAIDGMQKSGAQVTWQGPLESAGMRGREFLADSSDGMMMGRVWLSERFVYLLMISAKTREGLQAAETSKFYGSFTAY